MEDEFDRALLYILVFDHSGAIGPQLLTAVLSSAPTAGWWGLSIHPPIAVAATMEKYQKITFSVTELMFSVTFANIMLNKKPV